MVCSSISIITHQVEAWQECPMEEDPFGTPLHWASPHQVFDARWRARARPGNPAKLFSLPRGRSTTKFRPITQLDTIRTKICTMIIALSYYSFYPIVPSGPSSLIDHNPPSQKVKLPVFGVFRMPASFRAAASSKSIPSHPFAATISTVTGRNSVFKVMVDWYDAWPTTNLLVWRWDI